MSKHTQCPCGSGLDYNTCCEKIHIELSHAQTAEALMRARYCAFVLANVDFLYNSYHPSVRRLQRKEQIQQWAVQNKWYQLEIIKSTSQTVEFKAYYLDAQGVEQVHHEKSNFKTLQAKWYYIDGKLIT